LDGELRDGAGERFKVKETAVALFTLFKTRPNSQQIAYTLTMNMKRGKVCPADELFSLWQRLQLRYLIVARGLEINYQDENS